MNGEGTSRCVDYCEIFVSLLVYFFFLCDNNDIPQAIWHQERVEKKDKSHKEKKTHKYERGMCSLLQVLGRINNEISI